MFSNIDIFTGDVSLYVLELSFCAEVGMPLTGLQPSAWVQSVSER
jgi:hypothetical protein